MSVYNENFEAKMNTEEEMSKYMLDDLQLAAELGKTLLERNKELETTLKHHQNVIDDQAQEIEYLQKQTAALREVNDSRLRIYEQLEVGIQDLERANHRLIVENTTDKKHIKSLQSNIENLESKCEELNKNLEEAKISLLAEKRKNERLLQDRLNNGGDGKETQKLRKCENQNFDENSYDPDQAQNTKETDSSFEFLSSKNGGRNANSTALNDSLLNFNNDESTTTSTTIHESSKSANAINFINDEENEEVIRIVTELETTKKALVSEQQRVAELEEQLVTIIQENQSLQSRIVQTSTNEEMRSVHDELSILEEVRQGTMCSRCLRSVDDKNAEDDNLSALGTEDDEDRSIMSDVLNNTESTPVYRSAVTIKTSSMKPNSLDLNQTPTTPSSNPYRELVEKYEALLEVQRHSINRNAVMRQQNLQHNLLDDLQTSGEFSSINTKESFDEISASANANSQQENKDQNVTLTNNTENQNNSNGNTINNATLTPVATKKITTMNTKSSAAQIHHKICRRTPTDFSEAETSSSGFSDEISHKSTQTDERQGYFLCSIGDGEDCKFSIYDDASPIDSRFRNRPEYRELFKEIFAVLKKAAENKEEGENLPLLDDTHPNKVPPVTPANEDLPSGFCDDTQSVISSAVSEQSIAMSECITKIERKTAKKHLKEINQENKPLRTPSGTLSSQSNLLPINNGSLHHQTIMENGRILTPLKREPLEYVQVGVGIKKKNRRKNRNLNLDRSDSPILPSPPKIFYGSGKKRRELRTYIPSSPTSSNVTPKNLGHAGGEWSGHSMIIYNRNMQSPSTSPLCNNMINKSGGDKSSDLNLSMNVEYKPSTVSQDLHKLKKLDLSYAEVLRRADACKHHHRKK